MKTLKDDSKEFFRATRDANKIANYVLAYEKERTLTREQEISEGNNEKKAMPLSDGLTASFSENQRENGDNTMIYLFEQVWRAIDGDNKASTGEIIEALQEKISEQEHMASKLFHAREFETLTSVEQERNSFVQVMYGFQKLPFLDNGNESEIWEAAREKREEIDRGKSLDFQDIEVGQRMTFKPHDGKTTLTGTVKEINEREIILQCGQAEIPALREKGAFTKALELDRFHTKEYAKEQALKHVGEKGHVFTALNKDGVYEGPIVELTPTFAIQKLGEDAVLHRLKDLEKADNSLIQVGQDVSIVKGARGTVIKSWGKQHEEKEQRQNNGQSR
jgi:hypothetical protein